MIIWLMINVGVALTVTHFSRNDPEYAVLSMAIFLTCFLLVKIISSVFFNLTSWCKDCKISKEKSTFFVNVKEVNERMKCKSSRFGVVFLKRAPHSALIIKEGEKIIYDVYESSLSDPDKEYDFGVSLKIINRQIAGHKREAELFTSATRLHIWIKNNSISKLNSYFPYILTFAASLIS